MTSCTVRGVRETVTRSEGVREDKFTHSEEGERNGHAQ